jgi:ParB family chromosome partitioning protein
MNKLDRLNRTAGAIADESMGKGVLGVAPYAPPPSALPARLQGIAKARNAAEIPLDRIARDEAQPREEFDEAGLARLAESLKARGQLQPIRVRWSEDRARYVIICGERRWRAAALAGLATMSCVIEERPLDAGELLALQLVENALREDLRPIEQARAYKALMDRNGWSLRQVAAELAVDHTGVSKALALLDLPEAVRTMVDAEAIPPSVAYEVGKLDDPAEQVALAERVASEGLSRADVAEAVRAARPRGKGGRARPKARKVTRMSFRTPAGKVTIENGRGMDDDTARAALRAALDRLDAQGERSVA